MLGRTRDFVFCLRLRRIWPQKCRTLVLDFDGVLTDDLVLTSTEGIEYVRSSRSDGMGIELLLRNGYEIVVVSKETNGVVKARCRKLGVTCYQSVEEKLPCLIKLADDLHVQLSDICYIGHDVNDVACLGAVGMPLVVSDAHRSAKTVSALKIPRRGGLGAIRLVADALLQQ